VTLDREADGDSEDFTSESLKHRGRAAHRPPPPRLALVAVAEPVRHIRWGAGAPIRLRTAEVGLRVPQAAEQRASARGPVNQTTLVSNPGSAIGGGEATLVEARG